MQKKSSSKKMLIKAFLLIVFSFGLIISCKTGGNNNSVVEINHGNLVFEVDGQLHTKFMTTLPDTKLIMEGFQPSERLVIENTIIDKFKFEKVTEKGLNGDLSGKQWIVDGIYKEEGLTITKTLTLTVYTDFPDLISTKVTYTNNSGNDIFIEKWLNNEYTISSQGDKPLFWAFQGSSSSSRSDWIRPLESGYYQKNYMGMNSTDYGGGIPVTSVWRRDINIAIGHLALVPKRVNLPTEIKGTDSKVIIGVSKDFDERTLFKSNESITTLETFVAVSKGDYFNNLSRYSRLMQAKGITIVEPEDAAFEPIWCAWGYERQFTLDEIVNTLPKVKELGIKWAVLDDGFQIAEGDWNTNPTKFPKGNIEMKNLVDKIHDYGLKAKIWWTPLAADPHSKTLMENPDMKILQKNNAPQFITWWDAYYLSPSNKKTIEHTKETIRMFMEEWGFDGLKMDGQHMNAVAPDFNLENPEISAEELPSFFQMIYDEARKINPRAVIENCPCGTCMSYFNMASMNQAVSSDPISSWQIRHKGKTYKALIPNTAYYGDHVELSDNANDFASSFGVGAVLGTKFTWPTYNPNASKKYILTPEKEKIWKKWFSLYNERMLSKENYLGNLYDIGYDKPETHVIKKQDVIYYAFYADQWNGKIELKGLDKDTDYRIRDYFNNIDLGKISLNDPSINASFKDFLLIEVSPNKP
ncbi:MAG: alpha-galactosidase [Flavobacteriaceae bacterium]|nr:alpha-galactosidase [Flavobacteriaceae bacterium]